MASSKLKQFLVALEDEAGFDDIKIDVNTRSRVGDTPLHIASIQGRASIVSQLLECGAEIDATGEDGYTALDYAVAHGHIETVRTLVSKGCNPGLRFFSGGGETARELAESTKNIRLKHELLNALGYWQA
jgi:ankyrin repeat protein